MDNCRQILVIALLLGLLCCLSACELDAAPPTVTAPPITETQTPSSVPPTEAVSEPVNGFMVYAEVYNGFSLHVNGSGHILGASAFAEGMQNIISALELVGQPYEEGLVAVLQAAAAQQMLPDEGVLNLTYVAVDRGALNLLCQSGTALLDRFLSEAGFTQLQVAAGGIEFLPDTMPQAYTVYETYSAADYAAICAQAQMYDQLARNTEQFRKEQANYVENFPFCIELEHDGLAVQVFYRSPNILDSIHVSSNFLGVQILPVVGTDTYKVRIYAYGGSKCLIYYPDGQVDAAFGDDLLNLPVYGQVVGSQVYLPDTTPQDYETLHSLMENYKDLAVVHDENVDILWIKQKQRLLSIYYFQAEDQFEVYCQDGNTHHSWIYTPEGCLQTNVTKTDDRQRLIYSWTDTPEETIEYTCDYDAFRTYTTTLKKQTGETYSRVEKMILTGNTLTWYLLRNENDYYVFELEFVSEDSSILKTYRATDKRTGDIYYWILDGKEGAAELTEHVVQLIWTKDGQTKTLSFHEIPWGTGLVYPPHFAHEYTGGSVTYDTEQGQ